MDHDVEKNLSDISGLQFKKVGRHVLSATDGIYTFQYYSDLHEFRSEVCNYSGHRDMSLIDNWKGFRRMFDDIMTKYAQVETDLRRITGKQFQKSTVHPLWTHGDKLKYRLKANKSFFGYDNETYVYASTIEQAWIDFQARLKEAAQERRTELEMMESLIEGED